MTAVAQHAVVQQARGEQATTVTEAVLAKIVQKSTGELPITINFLGLCKAGKSQLQSAMIGSDLLPSATKPCTSIPTIYRHSPDRERCRVFYANYDEQLLPKLSESANFEGTATECRQHLNDLNDKARALAARLAREAQQKEAGGDHAEEDYLVQEMRREGVPMYTVVEVHILGLVAAGVPEEVLMKCQFVDSPGKGEAFNPVVDMTIKDITALSDLIVVLMDYRAMGTSGDAALWQALKEQRPDLLRELGDRSLYFLSHADSGGAGAMTVEEALQHARMKVGECIEEMSSAEQFTGGSGLLAAAARHMLRYFREGIRPSDEVFSQAIAQMVDADCPEDVTFAEAAEEMCEQDWQELMDSSGLPTFERKLAERLRSLEVLRQRICCTDLASVSDTILTDIEATLRSLEQSTEVLQEHQATLATVISRVKRYCDEDVTPLIARSKTSALQAINATVTRIDSALHATARDLIRVAEGKPEAVFENEEAAQVYVNRIAAEISRHFREEFAARAGDLKDVLNEQVAGVIAHFQTVILTSFQAYLAEAFQCLDVDPPALGAVDDGQLNGEKEKVRKDVTRLGTVDDNQISSGIRQFVEANNYTAQETQIRTRRVCVGVRRRFLRRSRRIYADQSYPVVVNVPRQNFPVKSAAVEKYVRDLYLANLANVKANFTEAAEDVLDHLHQVLIAAINAPLATAQARVALAVAAKQTTAEAQSATISALREQHQLLSTTMAQ